MTTQKEEKEKNKSSRENLGKFFYDLAKTSFTAMVAADVVSFFISDADPVSLLALLVIGIFVTSVFAYLWILYNKKIKIYGVVNNNIRCFRCMRSHICNLATYKKWS